MVKNSFFLCNFFLFKNICFVSIVLVCVLVKYILKAWLGFQNHYRKFEFLVVFHFP